MSARRILDFDDVDTMRTPPSTDAILPDGLIWVLWSDGGPVSSIDDATHVEIRNTVDGDTERAWIKHPSGRWTSLPVSDSPPVVECLTFEQKRELGQ